MKLQTLEYQDFLINGGYWIDEARGLRIEEYHGRIGLRLLRNTALAMSEDANWSSSFHGLMDLRDARLELSANDVIRLGLLMRLPTQRTSGWLVYVVADDATHGLVRMLGHWSRTTGRQRIFRSRREAENWLGGQRLRVPTQFVGEDFEDLREAG
jgi:hypothetical protein